jgi:hypothetical protein
MTTLEERMSKISNKAMANSKAEEQLLERIRRTNGQLRDKCMYLSSRVQELMALAKHCIENGINIGQHGYESCKTDFYTNGIGHPCGFSSVPGGDTTLGLNRSHIKGVGIEGGGAHGYHYIYLDEDGEVHLSKWNSDLRTQNYAMKELLDKFDRFEERFLSFIDNL